METKLQKMALQKTSLSLQKKTIYKMETSQNYSKKMEKKKIHGKKTPIL